MWTAADDAISNANVLPMSPHGMMGVAAIDERNHKLVGFAVAQLAAVDSQVSNIKRLEKHGISETVCGMHAQPPAPAPVCATRDDACRRGEALPTTPAEEPRHSNGPLGLLTAAWSWLVNHLGESQSAFRQLQNCGLDDSDHDVEEASSDADEDVEYEYSANDNPTCDWGVASALAADTPGAPLPALLYLMTIGTDPAYRKMGIAQRLLGVLERRASAHSRVRHLGTYLHVITYNDAARSFYARLGYSEVRRMVDFYGEKLGDALVMYKEKC